jgi:RHS repeat-associated protein
VTTLVNMQVQQSKATYDELGRLLSLYRPHPTIDGGLSEQPSILVEYFLPSAENGLKYSVMHTKAHDGKSTADVEYLESWVYVDGLGRALVTLSENDPGDGQHWIAGSFVEYDAKAAVRRKYLPFFYEGDPLAFDLTSAIATPYGRQRYDAFGRPVQTFDLDGTVTLESAYHALSTDLWDAADLTPGPHQGTYASARKDGHGRTVVATERIHVNGVIEARDVRTEYLATGEPEVVTRVRVPTSESVTRWMRYDTLGRIVLNVEPNTTKGFIADKTTTSSTMKAWRYAYNDAGDVVGTSDARGCGSNFTYDAAGRLLSENYSPCEAHQETYSTTSEVEYFYDVVPSTLLPTELTVLSVNYFKGRLVAVTDRSSANWTSYDGLGRVIQTAVLMAKPLTAPPASPPPTTPSITSRYTTDYSYKSFAYDGADREWAVGTGIETAELQGATASGLPSWFGTVRSKSVVTTEYTKRGTVKSASGSYGTLVASIERQADGLITDTVYGDIGETTTHSSYDNRRRLKSVQTYRGPPSTWSTPPPDYLPAPVPSGTASTFQLLLQDEDYEYDVVNNPIEIRDWRSADEWPDGAKPVTKKVQYDDLYRVSRIDYEYPGGDDTWVSPFAAENSGDTTQQDPRRAKPSPQVAFDQRILWQAYQFDWLGNTQKTDDDAKGFYDRSLGSITNDTGGNKPYQLKTATQGSGSRSGEVKTLYDDAGNLTRLDVKRNGPCLPAGANCSQRFDYRWDEVGRMVRARRWDVTAASLGSPSDPLPTAAAAADLNYGYDAGDQRVLKTAFDPTAAASYTVYLFDSLELRRATYGTNFERSKFTEVGYLSAHGVRLGRLVYDEAAIPTLGAAKLHVFFELGDYLGSTSIVIDKATSELVERGTFQAYGGAESDYRPERWKSFREDYRFTGKEEDVEVGLQYFGKRYLNPLLGRWISADPLTVHMLGSDLNSYAYVSGAALRNTDPLGLEKRDVKKEYEGIKKDYDKAITDTEAALEKASAHYAATQKLAANDRVGANDAGEALLRVINLENALKDLREKRRELKDRYDYLMGLSTGPKIGAVPKADIKRAIEKFDAAVDNIKHAGALAIPLVAYWLYKEAKGEPRTFDQKADDAAVAAAFNIPDAVVNGKGTQRSARKGVNLSGGGRRAQALRNKLKRVHNQTAAGGNRGVPGTVSESDAMAMGEAFVGPNYRTANGGRVLVSEDGLRQFRLPAPKRGIDPVTNEPFSRTGVQVNFESRAVPEGPWQSNVHLDVAK